MAISTTTAATTTTATTKAPRKLTKAEWDDIRALASTASGYDSSTSPIKGKTTMAIVNDVLTLLDNGKVVDAQLTLRTLLARETFNVMVGIESDRRRKN